MGGSLIPPGRGADDLDPASFAHHPAVVVAAIPAARAPARPARAEDLLAVETWRRWLASTPYDHILDLLGARHAAAAQLLGNVRHRRVERDEPGLDRGSREELKDVGLACGWLGRGQLGESCSGRRLFLRERAGPTPDLLEQRAGGASASPHRLAARRQGDDQRLLEPRPGAPRSNSRRRRARRWRDGAARDQQRVARISFDRDPGVRLGVLDPCELQMQPRRRLREVRLAGTYRRSRGPGA